LVDEPRRRDAGVPRTGLQRTRRRGYRRRAAADACCCQGQRLRQLHLGNGCSCLSNHRRHRPRYLANTRRKAFLGRLQRGNVNQSRRPDSRRFRNNRPEKQRNGRIYWRLYSWFIRTCREIAQTDVLKQKTRGAATKTQPPKKHRFVATQPAADRGGKGGTPLPAIANSNTQQNQKFATSEKFSRVARIDPTRGARVSPVLRKVLSLGRLAHNIKTSGQEANPPKNTRNRGEGGAMSEPQIWLKVPPTPPSKVCPTPVGSPENVKTSRSNPSRWWKGPVGTSAGRMYLVGYHVPA